MAVANSFNIYKQQQVFTSSPEKLILMLYDGAIRFCSRAVLSLEKGDFQEANNSLIKAQNIILEFIASLNMEYEVSHNLYILYDYLHRRLVEANVRKDWAIVQEVMGFLKEMQATWAEAALQIKTAQKTTGGVAVEG